MLRQFTVTGQGVPAFGGHLCHPSSLLLTFARAALRTKIGPGAAESEGCGGTKVEDDNKVWADLRRNPEGRGQFSPFRRR